MRRTHLEDVRRACLRLLEGRQSYPSSPAAKMITAEDVKTAKGYLAQLSDIRSRSGAVRSSEQETMRCGLSCTGARLLRPLRGRGGRRAGGRRRRARRDALAHPAPPRSPRDAARAAEAAGHCSVHEGFERIGDPPEKTRGAAPQRWIVYAAPASEIAGIC